MGARHTNYQHCTQSEGKYLRQALAKRSDDIIYWAYKRYNNQEVVQSDALYCVLCVKPKCYSNSIEHREHGSHSSNSCWGNCGEHIGQGFTLFFLQFLKNGTLYPTQHNQLMCSLNVHFERDIYRIATFYALRRKTAR